MNPIPWMLFTESSNLDAIFWILPSEYSPIFAPRLVQPTNDGKVDLYWIFSGLSVIFSVQRSTYSLGLISSELPMKWSKALAARKPDE